MLLGALALLAVVQVGCQKRLFPVDAPRTQYDLHDRIRNRYRPQNVEDEFGRPQPAQRERLGKTNLSS